VIIRLRDQKTRGSQMPDRVRKRPSTAKALARWDDEGGATKGAPLEGRDALVSLGQEEGRILRCLGAAVCRPTSCTSSLITPFPWASRGKQPSSSA
jgi:hypothetical protein